MKERVAIVAFLIVWFTVFGYAVGRHAGGTRPGRWVTAMERVEGPMWRVYKFKSNDQELQINVRYFHTEAQADSCFHALEARGY